MMGVKAYVQRVPAALRSQAIEWMEEAFQATNQNLPEGAAGVPAANERAIVGPDC